MDRVPIVVAALVIATLTLSVASPGEACTAVRLSAARGVLIAKNYDWSFGRALVVVNKRDLDKRALPLRPGDKPATWTSQYASVTFNQYGQEFPNGGMNEAGLVVETLWLDSSRFPEADERPTINELQWVQYQLDRFATVNEVIGHASETRISRVHGDVHYLACDKAGACAVLEFLEGKLTVTTGTDLATPTLTNHTYAESLEYRDRHVAFHEEAPEGTGSLARFTRASMAAGHLTRASTGDAFALLDTVKSGDRTQWQIVYEPSASRIHFRTQKAGHTRTIDLGKLDRGCASGALALDIDEDVDGSANGKLHALTLAENKALVTFSLTETIPSMADRLAPVLAAWPDGLACKARGKKR